MGQAKDRKVEGKYVSYKGSAYKTHQPRFLKDMKRFLKKYAKLAGLDKGRMV
jgi:hypothetical protein